MLSDGSVYDPLCWSACFARGKPQTFRVTRLYSLKSRVNCRTSENCWRWEDVVTASCGKRGRASEEAEDEGNSEEMGGSGGLMDGVVGGERIAADVGRVNLDECIEALVK